MKARKQVVVFSILFLLLVLPPMVYFYVTRGFNTFIKLEVIGKEGHKIGNFSFINQNIIFQIKDLSENLLLSTRPGSKEKPFPDPGESTSLRIF